MKSSIHCLARNNGRWLIACIIEISTCTGLPAQTYTIADLPPLPGGTYASAYTNYVVN
ncbi:MAG: hypothetical protein HYX71_11280 [Opitutae bacterium]|nr:hypothetical protein [Opitutae bacterium]